MELMQCYTKEVCIAEVVGMKQRLRERCGTMKAVCDNCGTHSFGTLGALATKGWHITSGDVKGSQYSVTLCPKCYESNRMVNSIQHGGNKYSLVCPKCGSKDVVSAPGSTNLKDIKRIRYICTKCNKEW